jgi:hypothetical protein
VTELLYRLYETGNCTWCGDPVVSFPLNLLLAASYTLLGLLLVLAADWLMTRRYGTRIEMNLKGPNIVFVFLSVFAVNALFYWLIVQIAPPLEYVPQEVS